MGTESQQEELEVLRSIFEGDVNFRYFMTTESDAVLHFIFHLFITGRWDLARFNTRYI